jgi:hypothetical protein
MGKSEPNSTFDIPPDKAWEARMDAEAEPDYAAGRVIPHLRMQEWLTKRTKATAKNNRLDCLEP